MKTNDSNVMEFIDEIVTQMTELSFGEDTFAPSSEVGQEHVLMFTEEAQDFYNERYDEVETLFTNLILNPKEDGKQ